MSVLCACGGFHRGCPEKPGNTKGLGSGLVVSFIIWDDRGIVLKISQVFDTPYGVPLQGTLFLFCLTPTLSSIRRSPWLGPATSGSHTCLNPKPGVEPYLTLGCGACSIIS